MITGASGFVGANLLRKLITKVPPQKIHVLLRKNSNTWRINDLLDKVSVHILDLRNPSTANRLARTIKPKIIFHLATHGAYPYQQLDEKEITDTNIICTFNLMQACTKVGFAAFINTGSSSEYGINKKPMSEDDKLAPITSYGVSKAWATLYGDYLSFTKEVHIITLRLFGVYGFYEPQGRLIPNVILSLLKNKQPTISSLMAANT
ncbi:MAG: NAD-dependent epimerase/dehydratase family protein, partial [Actinobacteria bacterium]|nr:NAD-dependent epimerase/dehydratase family protein [Actinomycetota bacterium]